MKKLIIGLCFLLVACNNQNSPEALREKFAEQMLNPSAEQHVYGGKLVFDGDTITAYDVPAPACVSTGSRLVKKGIISVNGTTPQRVSSAILTELCYESEKATIGFTKRK